MRACSRGSALQEIGSGLAASYRELEVIFNQQLRRLG